MDSARLVAADSDSRNWLSYGRTYSEQRFSPLAKIDKTSIKDLGLAWFLDLDTHRGQEATPLVIDGVMYSTSAWSKIQALDAATGKLLWQFDPKVPGETGVKACCDTVNRGVAANRGKLFLGTLDGRLIAIDAVTGKEIWSVVTVDQSKPYTITGAPRVIKDKVLIGNGGAEFGVRGYISAYDTETGKQLWRFYTVPGDPSLPFESKELEAAAKTWKGEWWKSGGGGTVWDAMAYDPELDLLYIGTGNGSPWNQKIRSPGGGDNLFLSSIVALRPDTGEYVWHYQTTPGETWDYTATQHIILADLTLDGRKRKVLMQAPKNGFFYVLDRTDGKLISAQPYATINWASSVDLATGRPIENPEARYPDPAQPSLVMPGPLGAHNWHPMSFSPLTGLVYIPAQETGYAYMDAAKYEPRALGFNVGTDMTVATMPQDAPTKSAMLAGVRGYLQARDPVTQKVIWSVAHESSWNGGVLSTAGDLVFQGNAMGELVAYDARNGEKLWSFPAQTGVVAPPMSYEVNGEQYIAVVAGWGGAMPLTGGDAARKGAINENRSRVLAFKIGGSSELPALPAPGNIGAPPPRMKEAASVAAGKNTYLRFCAVCHGDAAIGSGVTPDLRHSPIIQSADAWKAIVIDGNRKDRGMVSFMPVMSAAEAENVRVYVIDRANDERDEAVAAQTAH
ncbi:MAG TPA: PQQ-dependent dehydrogenase, methanol/ethanol family [Povalibacter sp.]|uniref:PQQ-dependent dehydrogenase, methanol/ethanol family n=1 Tax=Povalibacter sp. TaxID=1962978 RepID=UPI002C393CAC|nr:PQQ-dependent dehydrogenase, methanol/ethanol family [Povalibacter sp.]HMN47219.1 PQQ-dependent dehydrogenase, methanol/ethanol family [Povalibacter sp.]